MVEYLLNFKLKQQGKRNLCVYYLPPPVNRIHNFSKTRKIFYLLIFTSEILFSDVLYYQEANQTIILLQRIEVPVKKLDGALRWYKNSKGTVLGLKNNFFLKTKDLSERNQILKDFNLTIMKQYSQKIYLVKSRQNDPNLLSVIDAINTKTKKLVAYPNFYKRAKAR